MNDNSIKNQLKGLFSDVVPEESETEKKKEFLSEKASVGPTKATVVESEPMPVHSPPPLPAKPKRSRIVESRPVTYQRPGKPAKVSGGVRDIGSKAQRSSVSIFSSLSARLTVTLVLVALIPLMVIAVSSYLEARRALRTVALREVAVSTQTSAQAIEAFLAQFEAEVLSLSQTPPIQGIIRARDNDGVDPQSSDTYQVWVERLEQIFIPIAENKLFYQQLRYLDENGLEMVRVDFDGQQVLVRSGDELQDKSSSDYFRETMKLQVGEVYISELNLNREEGQVQVPHTPVLRFGTPIFENGDPTGERRGIVVLNIYADSFLDLLSGYQEAAAESPQEYLVNQEGYYLHHHSDTTREFGFDLGTDFNVNQDFVWTMSQVADADSFVGIDQTIGKVMSLQKVRFDPRQPERYWLLLDSLSEEAVLADLKAVGVILAAMGTGIMVVVFAVAGWLGRTVTRPITSLAQASERIAGGDWDAPLPEAGRDEVGQLTRSFGGMAARLRETLTGLEERVAARTRDMELAAKVGRRLSTVRDLDRLLAESVELIRGTFGLYYTQVYLVAAGGRALALRAGTGEVGERLVQRGHRLAVGPGSINGTAAAEKQAVIVADTTQSETFRPNPLLPNTRSEMAVPLLVGERLVGVLNLQHDRPGSLTAETLPAFEALAGQLAIAVENTNLLAETASAQAETEEYIRRLTRGGWEEFLDGVERSERIGYTYDVNQLESVSRLTEPLEPTDEGHTLSVPVAVGGESIGTFHLEGELGRHWTDDEAELVTAVTAQVAQQVENLRLLAEAEQYRADAEQAVLRTTREGWAAYIDSLAAKSIGFTYDLNEVTPLDAAPAASADEPALTHPLMVYGEPIGELSIAGVDDLNEEAAETLAVVAERLSAHIENARLLEETERGRQQLDKRAAELENVAEVSAVATTVLDPGELLQSVVDLTKSSFDLYHAHIYLLDATGDEPLLSLAAGAGDVGKQMVDQGWRIPLMREQSLVARAARTRQGVIVDDVRESPNFLPNPLLPDTRSEMAVPMIVGGKVLGVLDVQSDEVARFTEEDVNIQSTLAGQIASTLDNARLFEEIQQNSRELEFRGRQLEEQSGELERRGRELEASQQVTFAASEQVDPGELLGLVVNLIRDQSDLYHVQVYMVEPPLSSPPAGGIEGGRAAVLRESTGYAGIQLLKQEHQIPLNAPSLVARAIREGEAILMADVSQVEDWLPNPLLPHTQSELVVPLRAGGNVLGVLDVQSRTTDQFLPSTVALFQTMAEQVALLFQNSELLARSTEQAEELAVYAGQLNTAADMAERLSTILDPNQLLREVVELLQSRFGFYHAHIYLLEPPSDGKAARLVVGAGSGEVGRVLSERGHSIPLDTEHSLVARAARDRTVIVVNDTSLDSDFMPNPLLPQTRAELAMPLVTGGKVLGVLDVQDDQADRFTETDQATFSTLAGQIATALDNARLFEEQARAEKERARFTNQLRTAAEVTEQLSAILDPDQLLADVVTLLQDRFDLYHAHIYLLDEPADETFAHADPDEVSRIMRERKLVIRAGSGEVGQILREQAHSIPLSLEQSLVARAARSRKIVSVEDTQLDPDFMPNPLLSETRSEVAVPLVAGDRVLGVLDVQDNQPGRFDRSDLDIFSTLAGQIATALDNARLFKETQGVAERLREVDRLKTEFLANMSHELRTPLNSIIGYTELMLLDMSEELDSETLEDVQVIHNNGKHLLSIINDILDLAKIEAGRVTLNLEEIEVESLLDNVRISNAGLLVDKPVEMTIEVMGDIPLIVADRLRLNQILNNLVSNAVKFTEEGTVSLRAFADRSGQGDNGWVNIEVKDTGIGMSEEDLGNIFERFRQVDGSFTRRAEGTGLGLSITHHLVEMHGGEIEVRSEFGKGSTFNVRLPVRPQEET